VCRGVFFGEVVTWCRGVCFGVVVCVFFGVMVSWCRGVMVSWCRGFVLGVGWLWYVVFFVSYFWWLVA